MKACYFRAAGLATLLLAGPQGPATAQVPPAPDQYRSGEPAFRAVYDGDLDRVQQLLDDGLSPAIRDVAGRTLAHVAAYRSNDELLALLVARGVDINALEGQRYDVVTIAAVIDDPSLLRLALQLGADPAAITSPYDGTALIAAAHLGHDEVIDILLQAGAPVDHVNNLGWTALIEAVVLGDGSERYVRSIEHLLEHDADVSIADRGGATPLELARRRGFSRLVNLLER